MLKNEETQRLSHTHTRWGELYRDRRQPILFEELSSDLGVKKLLSNKPRQIRKEERMYQPMGNEERIQLFPDTTVGLQK